MRKLILYIFIVLQILWCGLSLVTQGLPGWSMFADFDLQGFEITQADREIDMYQHTYRATYFSQKSVRRFAKFYCLKTEKKEQIELKFLNTAKSFRLQKPGCELEDL